jgi:hypothetical protein
LRNTNKWDWSWLSENPALFGNLHKFGAEESNNPSLEDILDFVYRRFSKGQLEVGHEEIAEHFEIEKKEVRNIMRDEKCQEKYIVEGESRFGGYFMRYKKVPMYAYFSPRFGDKFYSIKNPFIQASAKGRSYDNKKKRKERLRKIMFGAEGIRSKGMLAAGIVVAFALLSEIKKSGGDES